MTEQQLLRRIKRKVGEAIGAFNLIEDGDRILVAISGGKDSWALLHVLRELCRRAPVNYQLVPVTIDPGFADFDSAAVAACLRAHGFEPVVEKSNCAEIIASHLRPGSSYCAFCARLRRGALYSCASRLGCNKIALGHHLDDHIETLLLNLFFSGAIAAMSPKLAADNGIHTVIRPLVYVEEELIREWVVMKGLPQIDCACPQKSASDQQRQQIKQLLATMSATNPHIKNSLIKALGNVQARHLLDKRLKDF